MNEDDFTSRGIYPIHHERKIIKINDGKDELIAELNRRLEEVNNALSYCKTLVTSDQRYDEGMMDEKLHCEAHRKLSRARDGLEEIKLKCSVQSSALAKECFCLSKKALKESE